MRIRFKNFKIKSNVIFTHTIVLDLKNDSEEKYEKTLNLWINFNKKIIFFILKSYILNYKKIIIKY